MSKGIILGKKGITLTTYSEMKEFAHDVVKSGLNPKGLESVESVVIAMQFGMELGLSPMQAIQNVAVINGYPSIWGDAGKALVLASGLAEYINEWHTGSVAKGDFVAHIESKRKGNFKPLKHEFGIAHAKRAGLYQHKKKEIWRKYPERMCMFRARGFNLRDNFADILKGIKFFEEVVDYPQNDNVEIELSEQKSEYGEQRFVVAEDSDLVEEVTDFDQLTAEWGDDEED